MGFGVQGMEFRYEGVWALDSRARVSGFRSHGWSFEIQGLPNKGSYVVPFGVVMVFGKEFY